MGIAQGNGHSRNNLTLSEINATTNLTANTLLLSYGFPIYDNTVFTHLPTDVLRLHSLSGL